MDCYRVVLFTLCDDKKVAFRCRFCFCRVVNCYFSFLVTVPLRCFKSLFASLVSGRKSKIPSFCVCPANTGLIFMVAVTTKSTQSFYFCRVVKC